MRRLNFLVVFTLLTLTTSLFAGERVVIEMHDQLFRGQNVLNLKRLARRFNPGSDLIRAELKSVKLVAKSRQGRGQAFLQVGSDRSYREILSGNSADFNSNRPVTYSRVNLDVFGNSRGNWDLHLQGNIKIKKIILVVKNNFNPYPSPTNRIRLNFHGQQFQGQQKIFLKQQLRKQRPNLRLANFNIKKVILSAKSKMGRGQATLVVGQHRSMSEAINGRPEDFHYNDPYTFDRVVLDNRSYNEGNGAWQIHLRGSIKVNNIVVVLERKHNNYR